MRSFVLFFLLALSFVSFAKAFLEAPEGVAELPESLVETTLSYGERAFLFEGDDALPLALSVSHLKAYLIECYPDFEVFFEEQDSFHLSFSYEGDNGSHSCTLCYDSNEDLIFEREELQSQIQIVEGVRKLAGELIVIRPLPAGFVLQDFLLD